MIDWIKNISRFPINFVELPVEERKRRLIHTILLGVGGLTTAVFSISILDLIATGRVNNIVDIASWGKGYQAAMAAAALLLLGEVFICAISKEHIRLAGWLLLTSSPP